MDFHDSNLTATPGRAPKSWRMIAASRRRERFIDDLMAATMICEQATGSVVRSSGAMDLGFGRAFGRHLSRPIGEASGSVRHLANGQEQVPKKLTDVFDQNLLQLIEIGVISYRSNDPVRSENALGPVPKEFANFFDQNLLQLSDFGAISSRSDDSVRSEGALGDLSAGPGAGQRIQGITPFPPSPTTRARAVIRRRYAVAPVPTGSRHGPPASTRAAPQRVLPCPTKCSSTPPIRRKPA